MPDTMKEQIALAVFGSVTEILSNATKRTVHRAMAVRGRRAGISELGQEVADLSNPDDESEEVADVLCKVKECMESMQSRVDQELLRIDGEVRALQSLEKELHQAIASSQAKLQAALNQDQEEAKEDEASEDEALDSQQQGAPDA